VVAHHSPYFFQESPLKDKPLKQQTNRAQEIIEAAYSVILEHGYCSASTQLIAQKAGITRSLLHYYFKNNHRC
jgi:AcrR family transcriptional regulator